jgi:hypothetical protein
MLRKSLLFVSTLLISLSIFAADPTMAVTPSVGEGDAAEMAKNLSKEFKILYKTVKGAKLSDVDSATAGKFKKCGAKLKCARGEAKKYKKSQYLLFPIVKTTDEGFNAILYIFDKNGKIAKKQDVSVSSDTDAEDFASEVAAKLMEALEKLSKGEGDSGDDEADEEEAAPQQEEAPKMTDREKKEVLRSAFKAYKAGKGKDASSLFRKAENLSLAETVDEIVQAVDDAKSLNKSGDSSRAIEAVNKVERKDLELREKGYKELQFIKETNKKRRYNEPGKDEYDKARKTFKSVKKDMKTISVWRDGEMKKLEDSMNGKLDEQKKLNEKFEKDEEKQLKAEKKQEREHQKKISALRDSIENLDSTYRDRLAKTDKEIEKLNRQLEDDRPAEEIYKKEIEAEIEAIEDKYKKGNKDLKKQLIQTKKQSKADIEAAEKEYADKTQALEKNNSDLEKKIKKLSGEVERLDSDFEAEEQKESEKFDKSVAAAEAQDSKDLEAAEKKADEETENLNKQLEDYDKKLSSYTDKFDKIDSEVSEYNDKQEEKLSKNQEKFDKKREDAERKFESERSAAEEKAEQAYSKGQAERAKKVETLETQMFEIQDKVEKYEKDPKWQKLKKDQAAASKDLAQFEDGHDKFIEKETASISKNYKAEQAKIDAEQKKGETEIKKETAAFKAKKADEKKALNSEMKKVEQEKAAFEKDIKKKQATINANKNNKIKEIEGRAAKREAERNAKAKQRKAQYDKNAAEKKKQLAALEKQFETANANADKTRDNLAQQLENKKAAAEKKVNDLEMAIEQKKDANENAIEKEKQAVYAKYEKKAETDKKAITAKITQLENSSKTFIAQRGKEEAKLRADLEAAEKKTDTMKDGFDKDAAKRKAAHEANLKAAEKREAAAKVKYEQSKNSIEKQYKAKVDDLIKSKSISFAGGSEFKEERDRTFEYSAYTKQLNAIKADALAAQGMEQLKDENIKEARKYFFDALYADANSKSAQNGLKEIEKTAGAMFDKAYADIQAGDTDSAKKILIKLRKELSPKSSYYLRVLALIEDTKDSGDSED